MSFQGIWSNVRLLARDAMALFLQALVCRGSCEGWYEYEYGICLPGGGTLHEFCRPAVASEYFCRGFVFSCFFPRCQPRVQRNWRGAQTSGMGVKCGSNMTNRVSSCRVTRKIAPPLRRGSKPIFSSAGRVQAKPPISLRARP